jgi:hypothetical protein
MRTPARLILGAVGLAATAACGGAAPAEESARPPVGVGPSYSMVYPDEEIEQLAADFRGSCDFARPPGAAADYGVRLRTRETPGGAVRVRSRARFDPADREHLLGELPSGTEIHASGPLAAGAGAMGPGYAIVVRDPAGRVCRGYLPGSVVEVLSSAR